MSSSSDSDTDSQLAYGSTTTEVPAASPRSEISRDMAQHFENLHDGGSDNENDLSNYYYVSRQPASVVLPSSPPTYDRRFLGVNLHTDMYQ